MPNVFKVKCGDVVILSVQHGAFLQTNPSMESIEKRINETAKETGVTFVVVPNLKSVKVLSCEERVEIREIPKPSFEDGV